MNTDNHRDAGTRRALRLASLALVIVGGIATTIQLSGAFDFGEGSLWLPVAFVGGLLALVNLRPRTTNRKDRRNG